MKIVLTFDVEEFDLPTEHGIHLSAESQMEYGIQGLKTILPLLNQDNVECTLFTTANLAQQCPQIIQQLSHKHEIASHTFYHNHYETKDLLASKIALEKIIDKPIYGLRMPRMKAIPMHDVINAGFLYDSSVNPCWLPTKYNNTHLPKTIYNSEGMVRFPATVTPKFRIPLFWLAFKNMPYFLFKRLAINSLRTYGYVNLYFHPWEFICLQQFKIPFYIKTGSCSFLLDRLHQLCNDLKQEGEFTTMVKCLQKLNFISIPKNEPYNV